MYANKVFSLTCKSPNEKASQIEINLFNRHACES